MEGLRSPLDAPTRYPSGPARLRRSEWRFLRWCILERGTSVRGQWRLVVRLMRRGLVQPRDHVAHAYEATPKGLRAFEAHPSNWGSWKDPPANCHFPWR